MANLDKDFEKVAKQINTKLKEAAAALKEVNELREEIGLETLVLSTWVREDFYDDRNALEALEKKLELINVREFERELGYAGWSTSSPYC